ncbi:MAG TPA: di-heme oxidoredictase family protein [Bryobacteraceae bacterium]|nr:di-heme oxidoredictase family protein [Bryobacteraceae bacterium]
MLNRSYAGHIGRCLACLGLSAVCGVAQTTPKITVSPATKSTSATPAAAPAGGVIDPGVRGGAPGAGGTFSPIDNTSTAGNQADQDFFLETKVVFQEIVSVSNTTADANGGGLGPAFNQVSCANCHSQPAIGGSSPATNPQVANGFANLDGASNPADTSQFLSLTGPIREVRFIVNAAGTAFDGGVHDIFTIAGRTDAPGCNLTQPNFDTQIANFNAVFRIPTPTFGLGLVEMVADSALVDNLNATSSQRSNLGIGGVFNTSGNDGTITRFGWKAQNKSLMIFAGEAYNVEMGVTNNLFQNDRFPPGTSDSVIANCTFNTSPEDTLNTINGTANTIVNGVTKPNPNLNTTVGTASEMSSDVVNFASFMQLLAPPTPVTSYGNVTAAQISAGNTLFTQIGCNLCHSPSLTTNVKNGKGASGGQNTLFAAMAGVTIHPYSDFALHHMGSTLADGIMQGGAGPDQFRTAPLWGIGQRIFFLHDGRTNNLLTAIQDHFSSNNYCVNITLQESFFYDPIVNPALIELTADLPSQSCGSEANQVVNAFNALNSTQQQEILDFLRSL